MILTKTCMHVYAMFFNSRISINQAKCSIYIGKSYKTFASFEQPLKKRLNVVLVYDKNGFPQQVD